MQIAATAAALPPIATDRRVLIRVDFPLRNRLQATVSAANAASNFSSEPKATAQ
jgi:hypothetical protein